jgi:serine/threonine protein kinase
MKEGGCILVFVDIFSVEEVDRLSCFLQDCADHDTEACFILVHHSHDNSEPMPAEQSEFLMSFIEAGVDDIIMDGASGCKLACAVQARINFHMRAIQNHSALLRRHTLTKRIDMLVWDYLRVRMDTRLPEIDFSIAAGEPKNLKDFEVGKALGQGSFGKVFEVRRAGQPTDSSREVIKSFSKASAASKDGLESLRDLKNQITTMRQLSTQDGAHPNITRLYNVYHSQTHVFLRMEYGGPENLGRRLTTRDSKKSEEQCFLPLHKVNATLSQCSSALSHLHVVHNIAHRDIKPENIVVSETPETITIQVTDFGLAKIVRPDKGSSTSRSIAGTLPYMAPEMVLEGKCDVFVSDMWSIGCLFLDVLCFNRFIERMCFKKQPTSKNADQRKHNLVKGVRDHLEVPGVVSEWLETYLRPELKVLLALTRVMLQGMLRIDPTERWTVKDLSNYVPSLLQCESDIDATCAKN